MIEKRLGMPHLLFFRCFLNRPDGTEEHRDVIPHLGGMHPACLRQIVKNVIFLFTWIFA